MNALTYYISNLNLYVKNDGIDKYYKISDNIYILVEIFNNVFVFDSSSEQTMKRYTHIKSIKELEDTIKNKTGVDLNVFLRKQKLNKILNGIY